MSTIALLLLLSAQGDWNAVRDAAKAALKNPATAARAEAATKLGEFDKPESAALLLDLWAVSTGNIRTYQSDKLDRIRKMEASPVHAKMQIGTVEWKGDEIKQREEYVALSAEAKALEAKIFAEEGVKPAIRASLIRMKSGEAVKSLVSRLGDSDWAMRGAAAEALGECAASEAQDALRKAAGREKDGRALVSILDALGHRREAESIPAIADALKRSPDFPVKLAAVDALHRIDDSKGIEPLIEALKDATGRLREEINAVLVALTGVDSRGDYTAWKAWFTANKAALLGGKYEKPPERKPDAGGTASEPAKFYGIPVISKRVAFVLDRSGSMKEPAEWKPDETEVATGGGDPIPRAKEFKGRKIDVAKHELRNAIWRLKEDVRFNIIIYNHEYQPWLDEGLEAATRANKEKAIAFIDALEPDGQTNIFDPLERAFLLSERKEPKEALKRSETVEANAFKAGVDTIYLLSDGVPNNGRIIEPGEILSKMIEMNRTRRVKIHTIGVGADAREDFMRALADQNGGVCVIRK